MSNLTDPSRLTELAHVRSQFGDITVHGDKEGDLRIQQECATDEIILTVDQAVALAKALATVGLVDAMFQQLAAVEAEAASAAL